MIIKGGARNNADFYAAHLMRHDTNERVDVAEFRGFVVEDVREAFRDLMGIASGTKCKNPFYVVSINPDEGELLTAEQWQEAVDRLENKLGLTGQARMVIEHEKHGRTHRHVVWSRIDLETMGVISDSFNYRRHEEASREIEAAFRLRPVESVLIKDRQTERPERRPADYEGFRAVDTKIDPLKMREEITALWNAADSGKAFAAALEQAGYQLARGDRRDFVLVDSAGDDHSLARRIQGTKTAEIRARMADVDREALPSVAEARELARAAAGNADAAPQAAAEPEAAIAERPTEEAASGAGAKFELPQAATEERQKAPRGTPDEWEDMPRGVPADRQEAPRATMQERRAAPRGTPADWQTMQPGQGSDRREQFTGWERLARRMRDHLDRAWEMLRDDSSGSSEAGLWVPRIDAGRQILSGLLHRDAHEVADGVTELTPKSWAEHVRPLLHFAADIFHSSGQAPPTQDIQDAQERAHGEEVLRHLDAKRRDEQGHEGQDGDPHHPDEHHRERARPGAQVEAPEPDDRPQEAPQAPLGPQAEAAPAPSDFERLAAEYAADRGEDSDAPEPDSLPDSQPDTAPDAESPDCEPDMD